MQSIHVHSSTCIHTHTYIHTYVTNVVLASCFETMNHIAANRVKKIKNEEHPETCDSSWGHASKSRQLPGGTRPSQQGGKTKVWVGERLGCH